MDNKDIVVRRANGGDVNEITQLFYNTIQGVNSKDYSQEQIDDWSSWHIDIEKWLVRILEQHFIVAVYNKVIVGFSSIEEDGYLDFMFVHKDFQRKGIGHILLKAIEEKARLQKNETMSSDVSLTAKSFFEAHGFKVEKEELKKSRNIELINYQMIKFL